MFHLPVFNIFLYADRKNIINSTYVRNSTSLLLLNVQCTVCSVPGHLVYVISFRSLNYFTLPKHLFVLHRFTRPERLGSEAKIKCGQCQSYQVSVLAV